jgi:hypothetical protein
MRTRPTEPVPRKEQIAAIEARIEEIDRAIALLREVSR